MTKLTKSLILALMVPILLAPKMSKAIYVPEQPNFDQLSTDLYQEPETSLNLNLNYDPGITLPESLGDETDPETLIENAKDNYELTFSPNLDNGTFYFNNVDKTNLMIVADNNSDNTTIEAVSAEIRNNLGQTVDSVNFNLRYGKFMYNFDLSDLPTQNAYVVILTINSKVYKTSDSNLSGVSYSFTEKTNAVTLIGEEVDTSNIDEEETNNDPGITLPDSLEDEEEVDPETLIENAKDNYELTFSPNLDNGIFYFNNVDKTNLMIVADNNTDNTTIEAVSAEIRNNVGQTVKTADFELRYGKFMHNFDLSDLPTQNAYVVILTINSKVYKTSGSNLSGVSYSFTEKTNAVTLIGEEVDTSNIDDNEENTTEEEPATINDEIDNYKVDFNQTTSTYNNEKRYYFRNSSDSLIVKITADDQSSNAVNRINEVIYRIYRKDNNKLVRYQNVTQPDLYNNYKLAVNFNLLDEQEDYEVIASINYQDTDNSQHEYSRDYHIINLIPKAVSNDDNNNDDNSNVDDNDDNSNDNNNDNGLDIQEGHNISYNINQNLTKYDGNEVYLYNENELVDIRIWQNSYSNDAPSIESMTLLENNSSIENCYNSGICQFRYESPLNETVNLDLRVNYKSPNSNHTYSRNYDLGQHLRKDDNSNQSGDDNDNTADNASLSDFTLIKGSTASVYLVNKSNERYYIPDWSVLKSWYNQPNIMQVNDIQLSQYQLKGNMIYRPGSLIKIATDPKCYAVGLDGSLRWVYNEDVARGIYGSNWNKNIYIVPDALFPSYNFAEPVYQANDFDMPSLNEALQMYR